jgi:hypothetical protein
VTTTTEATTVHDTLAANLRTAAEIMQAHPDLPIPYITTTHRGGVEFAWYLTITAEDFAEQKRLARLILRTIGGKWDKKPGSEMNFKQGSILDDPISYIVQVSREAVCRRVVTGTEEVTIPAVEAEPERVETVETVEWICEPVLAEAVAL